MTYAHHPLRKFRLALMSFAGCMAVLSLTLTGCSGTPNNVDTATAPLSADAPYEARLANYLTEQGVAMYGAFWCPHCEDQKAMFGDAIDRVPYVECDPEGDNAQPELCMAKEIKGYPTWEINGEFYPGARSLEELAQLSGFTKP